VLCSEIQKKEKGLRGGQDHGEMGMINKVKVVLLWLQLLHLVS
jgi:hypothetical protein